MTDPTHPATPGRHRRPGRFDALTRLGGRRAPATDDAVAAPLAAAHAEGDAPADAAGLAGPIRRRPRRSLAAESAVPARSPVPDHGALAARSAPAGRRVRGADADGRPACVGGRAPRVGGPVPVRGAAHRVARAGAPRRAAR
jgi:hypothetical protein